jgi:hypothetical protein
VTDDGLVVSVMFRDEPIRVREFHRNDFETRLGHSGIPTINADSNCSPTHFV